MPSVKNGSSYVQNGWKYISIKGRPYERGYAYGTLCADDFAEVQRTLRFSMMESYGKTWESFIVDINRDFKQLTHENYNEFYLEMDGIANGCCHTGTLTTIDEIIAWNFYCSLPYWYSANSDSKSTKEGGSSDRCSAFMAVGDWTTDGSIVCGHNSFVEFIDGQFSNIVLDVNPQEGHRFIMQTSPCWIWSGTDFFVTSKGIIGTETTFGGFIAYEQHDPIGYRIRKAMQYGNTLDDYCDILLTENSGDYANAWLFGDVHTNEILRIELGLKYHAIERTHNGYFIGFNAPYDSQIRNLEIVNSGFYDIRRHQGARLVRLEELMDLHKGKINVEIAKQIMADHYDVYTQSDNPCSRTVCSHYELDKREYMSQIGRPMPYAPRGAVDGIVCSSADAKKMSFIAKFGSSCSIPFISSDFFAKHRQYAIFQPYVKDRPCYPWTVFQSKIGKKRESKRNIHGRRNNRKTIRKRVK